MRQVRQTEKKEEKMFRFPKWIGFRVWEPSLKLRVHNKIHFFIKNNSKSHQIVFLWMFLVIMTSIEIKIEGNFPIFSRFHPRNLSASPEHVRAFAAYTLQWSRSREHEFTTDLIVNPIIPKHMAAKIIFLKVKGREL